MARPSRYTTKLGDAICKRIAEGESLRSICAEKGMPSISRVMAWLASESATYAGFREQYTHARDLQAEVIFDRLADTAADTSLDVNRAKLIVDTEKWRLGRMKPKKYGTDRIEHAGDAEAPLAVRIARVNRPPADGD